MNKKDIYGLIGYPVKHSLSAAMHNAAFKERKINAEYRLFEVKPEDLEGFLLNSDKEVKDTKGDKFRTGDIKGFNITVPHKIRAEQILSKGSENQSVTGSIYYVSIGAINTVKREKFEFKATNTDISGFDKSLREESKFDTKDKETFVIGCGGAGRAVIAGLMRQRKLPPAEEDVRPKKIYVYDRSKEVVVLTKNHFDKEGINNFLEFISQEKIPEVIKKCQLLVNASPVGMKEGDPSIIDRDLLHKDLFVYDLVYNRNTQLIKDAEVECKKAVGGLGMLLYQGVKAWELWMNQKAPVAEMRDALEKALKK